MHVDPIVQDSNAEDDAAPFYIKVILKSAICIADKVVTIESFMRTVEFVMSSILKADKILPTAVKDKTNAIIMKLYDRFCLRQLTKKPVEALKEIVESQGDYVFTYYTIQASDGMPLQIHRLRKKTSLNSNSVPIFIQHGLLSSSADFLLEGGMAYKFADAGRDVWLGNFRGSIFSRRQLRERINDESFWGYSVDDHGIKDLPPMVDYVLEETKHKQIVYIGHSMGTTALFIMCDLKPEYNLKINKAYLLAPVADLTNIDGLPKNLVKSAELSMKILEMMRIYTLFFPRLIPGWSVIGILIFQMCGYNAIGADIDYNINKIKNILKFSPSGSTTKTLIQYLKCHQEKALVSSDENEEKHIYTLIRTNMPTVILWSEADVFAGDDNIRKLIHDLPNVVGIYKMPDHYGHLDFLWDGKPASDVLNNLIVRGDTPTITSPTKLYSSDQQAPRSVVHPTLGGTIRSRLAEYILSKFEPQLSNLSL